MSWEIREVQLLIWFDAPAIALWLTMMQDCRFLYSGRRIPACISQLYVLSKQNFGIASRFCSLRSWLVFLPVQIFVAVRKCWDFVAMLLLCNIVRGLKSYASGEISCDSRLSSTNLYWLCLKSDMTRAFPIHCSLHRELAWVNYLVC